MGLKSSPLLCLAILLAVSSAVHAMNITEILGEYPEFATFNRYLTETKLADQINKRNTITILALNDGALGSVSGKPEHAIKAVLSTHVVLDYFDERKLVEAIGGKQQLTTLYQASGLAQYNQGFIKVGLVGEGDIAFGSAATGAPLNSELVKTVTSMPYNVSILQVTRPLEVPGLDALAPKAPVKAPAPLKPPPTEEEVSAPSPSNETDVETEAPTEAPTATPASSPSSTPAPVASDETPADAQPPASSSSRTTIGLVGAVIAFTSVLVAM